MKKIKVLEITIKALQNEVLKGFLSVDEGEKERAYLQSQTYEKVLRLINEINEKGKTDYFLDTINHGE